MTLFQTYKLEDLLKAIFSGGTPSTTHPEYWNGEFPWLSSGETNHPYISKTEKTITQEGINQSSTRFAPPGAVVMASAGQGKTRGQTSFLKIGVYINQSIIAMVPDETQLLAKYLYYNLQFRYDELRSSSDSSSTRGSITTELLKALKITIPDLPTQEKIASILSAYDDAIENNNKRIKILEKMAENLYREWFVRMRFPGHETAEYENGLPKGWSVKRMQEFCYVTDGTHDTPQPKTYGIPLVTGKSISNGFIDFSQTYNIAVKDHEAIQKRSGVVTGDIIFSNIGTIGNCCIVDYDREFSVKNAIIFKPNTWAVSVYLYYWLTSSSVKNLFLGQSNGASQQFVGLTYMRRMKIFIPSKHVIESFGKSTRPILEQRKILHRKNASLSYQRNKLLSRLLTVNQNYISGKIK